MRVPWSKNGGKSDESGRTPADGNATSPQRAADVPAATQPASVDQATEAVVPAALRDRLLPPPQETLSPLAAAGWDDLIADPDAASDLAPDRDPAQIGHIRLEGVLGSGGMGRVYRGFDELLERPVAVKTLRHRRRADPAVRARLRREARVLSKLNHPQICQLYDLIETPHADYLVLELVEGHSLRQLMTQRLDHHTRLRLAEQIAEALAVAHARGIVHRDLKPENVMVDAAGAVKVLDFGIARFEGSDPGTSDSSAATTRDDEPQQVPAANETPASDETASREPTATGWPTSSTDPSRHFHTMVGSVLGTAAYMSPEQARAEPVGPASDIFSFGALLQEMWSGVKPVPPGHNIERMVWHTGRGHIAKIVGLPRRLTELVTRMRSFEPSERPSAREVLATLRRYRDAPRRRLITAGAALAVLLVAAGALKYTLDLRREQHQATAARAQAETLVNFLLDDLYQGLEPLGRLDLIDQVARKSLAYFESLPDDTLDAAGERPAVALRRISDVLVARGDITAAETAAGDAVAIDRRRLLAQPTDRARQRSLASSLTQLGQTLDDRGETAVAARHYAEAEALLDGLVASEPGDQGARLALADLLASHLAAQARRQGNIEVTQHHLGRALALLAQPAVPAHSASARAHEPTAIEDERRIALVELHYVWGLFEHFERGNSTAAIEHYQRAIAQLEELLQSDPLRPRWRYRLAVLSGQGLCTVYRQQGRQSEADLHCERARQLLDQLVLEDPTNGKWRHASVWEHIRSGNLLAKAGDRRGAEGRFARAVELAEELVARAPRMTDWQGGLAAALSTLASHRADHGDWRGALEPSRRAREVAELQASQSPDNLFAALDLAFNIAEQARVEIEVDRAASQITLDTAVAKIDQLLAGPVDTVVMRESLAALDLTVGDLWQRLGQPARAAGHFERALTTIASVRSSTVPSQDLLEVELATLLQLGRREVARQRISELEADGWSRANAPASLRSLLVSHGLS